MSAGEWRPIAEVFPRVSEVVKKALETKWLWFNNPNVHVKYINIRVDMRDGRCIITDNQGRMISVDQLELQEETKR